MHILFWREKGYKILCREVRSSILNYKCPRIILIDQAIGSSLYKAHLNFHLKTLFFGQSGERVELNKAFDKVLNLTLSRNN